MKRITLAVVVLVAAGLAAGCGGGGTQHESEMSSMPAQTPAPAAATQTTADGVEVTFRSEPQPPRAGETTFEVAVRQAGQAVADAEVSVELVMPAMPSMNMAEMRNTVALTHEADGRYRGAGPVMMAGTWNVIVHVRRAGQGIAAPTFPLTAE